jgi:hypothetical protein
MRKILLAAIFLGFYSVTYSQPKQIADSVQIKTTVLNFYNWYNKNWKKLDGFKLYSGIKVKDSPPYKINWKEAERYFAFIKINMPQLGNEFINNERKFFRQCDSAFRAEPEEEMPYGFDYDRFTNSQEEPQGFIEDLKKAKQWSILFAGDTAHVDILGTYSDNGKELETVIMCLEMKKEMTKWKIAKIGCVYDVTEK